MPDRAGAGLPPHELWRRAAEEHPNDPEKRRARYMELMIEAGHVIEKPGPKPVPPANTQSGWHGG